MRLLLIAAATLLLTTAPAAQDTAAPEPVAPPSATGGVSLDASLVAWAKKEGRAASRKGVAPSILGQTVLDKLGADQDPRVYTELLVVSLQEAVRSIESDLTQEQALLRDYSRARNDAKTTTVFTKGRTETLANRLDAYSRSLTIARRKRDEIRKAIGAADAGG